MENNYLLWEWDNRIWHLSKNVPKALYKINCMLKIEQQRCLIAYIKAKQQLIALNGK